MAQYHQDGKHLDFVSAAGAEVTGGIIVYAGGVGIVDPKPDGTAYATGDLGSVTVRGVVKVANSGVVFADGALVGYSIANDNAVATTTGDMDIGTCVGGAGATEDVLVWLNQGL